MSIGVPILASRLFAPAMLEEIGVLEWREWQMRGDFGQPQVVIVGGGPTGLSLAIELGSRSIRCLLLEKNERAGYAPRAKTTNARTREHLRRWGIADRLAAVSPFGVDYPSNILFVTRLSGHCITRFENALSCAPARDSRYSEHSQWIPQYKVEGVLREHARSLSTVCMAFGQEFVDFEQDSGGVSVLFRDVGTGEIRSVSAAYLVGADGARSLVREKIGARMEGKFGLSRNYNIVFEAPGLAQAHPHGPGIMYWQINNNFPSFVGPMDQGDLWFFMPLGLADGVTFKDEEALQAIRTSTGIDRPYRIKSSDEWVASRLLANYYSNGRVFLAGDACHLHPPFGGYGMNMGVADAVDLGWKIAAVLQGWGGENLLASYELERRQNHEFVLDEAEANHSMAPKQLYREGIEADTPAGEAMRKEVSDLIWRTKRSEFYGLGVVLGYRYTNSPVISYEGDAAAWKRSWEYLPSAAPGCLTPHQWLDDGRSLYDLLGDAFTLLVLDDAGLDQANAAKREADHVGVPLKIVCLPDASLMSLCQAPLVLVRPDQHVAWRGRAWPRTGLFAKVSGHTHDERTKQVV